MFSVYAIPITRSPGRENAHTEEGYKLVQRLQKELEPVAKLEQSPQMQGRRIVVIFAPK